MKDGAKLIEGDTGMASGGIDVHLRGVIHLYQQDGPDIVALRGVDLDIEAGEMVALLGPSGMGKSTLLQLLAGMMRPSTGEIRIGQIDLGKLAGPELQRLRATEVSYLLQNPTENLLPYATAVQNVWFAQQASGRHRVHDVPDPHEHLALLGLRDVADRRVAELPRGMQQQVALAAAVGNSPRLLLADEPTNQLDSPASAAVVSLLQTINAQLGTTVVLVTHDPAVAGSLARTITIRDGRVGAEGRLGTQYAVIDSSGSVQLPPEILELFPPQTRLIVERHEDGIALRPEPERP